MVTPERELPGGLSVRTGNVSGNEDGTVRTGPLTAALPAVTAWSPRAADQSSQISPVSMIVADPCRVRSG